MRSQHPSPRARTGFTLTELLVALIIIAILVCVLLPAMHQPRHRGARPMKDATQVRGIVQSMIVWADSNAGFFPLPSRLDAADATVGGPAEAKDNTANILAVLIFNGNISPEICISPAESNTAQVAIIDDYQFTSPASAAMPADALWDPRFRGTPLDEPAPGQAAGGPSNNSYAHLVPIGNRLAQWRSTFSTTTAALGNRGPQYAPADSAPHPSGGRWALAGSIFGTGSNTLLIHGGRSTWEGSIGYSDGHVTFETRPNPEGVTYTRSVAGKPVETSDNLFVNESDETGGDGAAGSPMLGINAYLRPVARTAWPTVWVD